MAERIGLVLYCTPDLDVDASEVFDECCKINTECGHTKFKLAYDKKLRVKNQLFRPLDCFRKPQTKNS